MMVINAQQYIRPTHLKNGWVSVTIQDKFTD
jgi:hypothetical protein